MDVTREMLKMAALALFVKDGYEGARLVDIAKAVNIKTPSIYFHFTSKEHLFTELFDDIRDKKFANIAKLHEKLLELTSSRDRLFCIYTDFSNRGYEDNEEVIYWKRCALFPPSFLKEKIHQDLIAYQHKFVDELRRPIIIEGIKAKEIKDIDVEKCIVAFLSMIQGMFSEFRYSELEAYKTKIALLWEYFWDSVKYPDVGSG